MDLVINTDGASRGNPGPAAYGFIIKNSNGMILHQEGKVLGIETNNIAEYMGAYKALLYVRDNFNKKAPHKIIFQADSQLVIRQLSGIYKIKNPKLKVIYQRILDLLPELGEIEFRHVPRKENFIPDRLANKALDS